MLRCAQATAAGFCALATDGLSGVVENEVTASIHVIRHTFYEIWGF